MKKKILIVGANGKIGSVVCKELENDYEIIKGLKEENWEGFQAEMIIDFGSAESSVMSAEFAFKNRVPLIVGSTGQTEKQFQKIRELARDVPFMICSNFSVGISKMKKCVTEILKGDVSDVCIFEKHHKLKKDAPSGTALSFEKLILTKTKVPIQMLAERGGEEIGTHKIDFYFGSELVSISHQAFSRKAFAEGIVKAIRFMINQKDSKEYFFDDMVWQTWH